MVDEYQGGIAEPLEPGQALPQTSEGAAQADAPEPITKKELEAFKKELTGELLRVIQSQTDKAKSSITKEVDAKLKQVEATFKELRDSGYEITDDDLKLARTQAIRDVIASSRGQERDAIPVSIPQDDPIVVETNRKMRQLQKRYYNYELDRDDPEFKDVPFSDSTPEEFLFKYEQGLRSVIARNGLSLPTQVYGAQAGSPSARVPTPVGAVMGNRDQQLNKRLMEIQSIDPFKKNPTLSKEREEILAELRALGR